MPPVNVLLVAQLEGADDTEDYSCPRQEWEWGDGARSAYESDWPPFEPGVEFTRRFSAMHAYSRPGDYQVTLRLHRADHSTGRLTEPAFCTLTRSYKGGGA
jgi:hypothetical protein